jgi:hypothetical protein
MAGAAHARRLRAALRMLRPPHMAPARSLLLRRDAAVDLAVLSRADALHQATLVVSDCTLALTACYAIDSGSVPFLDTSGHNLVAFRRPVGPGNCCPHLLAVSAAATYDADAVEGVVARGEVGGDVGVVDGVRDELAGPLRRRLSGWCWRCRTGRAVAGRPHPRPRGHRNARPAARAVC